MPIKSKSFFLIFFVLVLITTTGCSGGYEADTGLYQGDGITIFFPTGWEKEQTIPGAIFTIKKPEQFVQMSLFIQELPENTTFEQYLQRVSSNMARVGAHKKDDGTLEMGGKKGRWVKREIKVGGNSFESLIASVMNGDKVYSIMGFAASSSMNEWEPVFEKVAESIQFDN